MCTCCITIKYNLVLYSTVYVLVCILTRLFFRDQQDPREPLVIVEQLVKMLVNVSSHDHIDVVMTC